MKNKCQDCDRYACEVALKTCFICKITKCTFCGKENYKTCKDCDNLFCNKCLSDKKNYCYDCDNKAEIIKITKIKE